MAIRDPHCQLCPLGQNPNVETVCLTGNGPVPARLAIYGEAPGYYEDNAGEPFIGKSGELLNRELKRVGIDRADVFVSNAVRCRPDENGTPKQSELRACRVYTEKELAAVKPEVVLLLGNSALQGLLKTSGITKKRGAAIEKDGIQYLPTFHPAAVLRDPALLEAFRSDLLAFKRLVDGTNQAPETKINHVRTLGDLGDLGVAVSILPPETIIVPDVETGSLTGRKKAGLEPYAPDSLMWTIGLSWVTGESWVVPFEHPEHTWERPVAEIAGVFNSMLRGKRLVNHNIKFDLHWMSRYGIRGTAFGDTALMAHLLDENRSNGLKPLARQFLGADLYEDDIDYDGITPLDALAVYNGQDTDYTLRLYHIFREQLAENPRLVRLYGHILMPALNALLEVEKRGFPVNVRRLRDRHLAIVGKLAEIEAELLTHVDKHRRGDVNWNPSGFLRTWLFDDLGLPIVKVSAKTESPSVDEEVLLHLADKHPAIPLILERRKWVKWESTYTRNWIIRLKLYGIPRLFPSYNLTGTVTGRLSSNMQQIPRDNYIRGIIGAPKGYKLVEADFSQIELRIAAMMAKEPTMIAAYQRGDDLHMVTAMAITGKPASAVTKEERSRAKPVGFGFLYGMGWKNYIPYARAQFGQVVTAEEAQSYRTSFFLRYPALVDWHARMRRIVNGQGYVTSPIGRVRRLPTVNSSDDGMRAEAERQAINSPVQGFASDLTLLAIARLNPLLDPERGRIIGQVHDSILIEAEEDYADEAGSLAKGVMESLPLAHLFGFEPTVPVVADITINSFWGGQ